MAREFFPLRCTLTFSRAKSTSTSSLNTSPKTSTAVHGPSPKSSNKCQCSKSSFTCTNACAHWHTFTPWGYVIGISNRRTSSWIPLVVSSNCAILEAQRFSSRGNRMSVTSARDITVPPNSSLVQQIILLLLVCCYVFLLTSDIWSTGCVMAELLTGSPLFPGESGIDQLVEIIKVLGTPSKEQIRTMNPNYMEHKFPQIKPHPFNRVLRIISGLT